MPSLLKTAFLQLNKWAGNEYPKREDFVSDNEKIDQFAVETATQLAQKANKQQENWIKPLLQNGWLFQGAVRDISYYKDEIGQVRLTGEVSSGIATNGTIILTMPVGYRPHSTIMTLCVKANDASHFVVSINVFGEVSITGLNSTGTLRINVSFRAA